MYFLELTKGYVAVGGLPHTRFGPFNTHTETKAFYHKINTEGDFEGIIQVICRPERLG